MMYGKRDRFLRILEFFAFVTHFYWLGQTHQFTTESVIYKSVIFYVKGPRDLPCTVKTLRIRNIRTLLYASVFLQASVFVTDNIKHISLRRNLSVRHKIRVSNVLYQRPLD